MPSLQLGLFICKTKLTSACSLLFSFRVKALFVPMHQTLPLFGAAYYQLVSSTEVRWSKLRSSAPGASVAGDIVFLSFGATQRRLACLQLV